ncbi:Hypothetical_protein [Hexamita inflata]|uniref:Hypothetical_protein n=1 Tax=Hexamita inflata TaxID=28002 RepID=A0AA86TV88_9EUKA|nr:Hypothetical protein HINF_LOCUS10518 [Hexamita inflata]
MKLIHWITESQQLHQTTSDNQGKLFNSLNEYRYNYAKSKRNDDIIQNTDRLYQLKQAKLRRKQAVWMLQVRKLQPKIHMRSHAAVISTQQLLNQLHEGYDKIGSCIEKLIDQKYKQTFEQAN